MTEPGAVTTSRLRISLAWVGPVVAVVVAALLRFYHLGARSVWSDEGATWTVAHAPLRELIRLCAGREANPPLFYLLTSAALKFGQSEVVLRLVSLLASLGLVWLTYRLARLAAPRGQATLAAVIAAISPLQVMYAQEARAFALAGCLTVLSLYLFARAALLGRRRAWGPYVVASALALYTQNLAALGIGVQAACVALEPRARRRVGAWLLAQLGVLALYLPWLFVNLRQAAHVPQGHGHLAWPDAHGVLQVLQAVFISPVPLLTRAHGLPGLLALVPRPFVSAFLVAVPALPLAAAALATIRGRAGGATTRLSWYGLVVPLLVVYAVSANVPPSRMGLFLFLTPMLAVLLALGLARIRPGVLGSLWVIVLLIVSEYGCFRYDRDYGKERWNEVVAHVVANSDRGHAAALVPVDVGAFDFYNHRQAGVVAAFEVSHPDVPLASGYAPAQLDEMERAARERAAPYDQVWVVMHGVSSRAGLQAVNRAESAAEAGRSLTRQELWKSPRGSLLLMEFRREPGKAAAQR